MCLQLRVCALLSVSRVVNTFLPDPSNTTARACLWLSMDLYCSSVLCMCPWENDFNGSRFFLFSPFRLPFLTHTSSFLLQERRIHSQTRVVLCEVFFHSSHKTNLKFSFFLSLSSECRVLSLFSSFTSLISLRVSLKEKDEHFPVILVCLSFSFFTHSGCLVVFVVGYSICRVIRFFPFFSHFSSYLPHKIRPKVMFIYSFHLIQLFGGGEAWWWSHIMGMYQTCTAKVLKKL